MCSSLQISNLVPASSTGIAVSALVRGEFGTAAARRRRSGGTNPCGRGTVGALGSVEKVGNAGVEKGRDG
jgi:hypothetical protein